MIKLEITQKRIERLNNCKRKKFEITQDATGLPNKWCGCLIFILD